MDLRERSLRWPRRHALVLCAVLACMGIVIGVALVQLPSVTLLRDHTLTTYLMGPHLDAEWQGFLRQFDVIAFGRFYRALHAAGAPIGALQIALVALTGIVLVPATVALAAGLTGNVNRGLILVPVLLYGSYSTVNLFRQFGESPGLVELLPTTFTHTSAIACVVAALAGALRGRASVAAGGIIAAAVFHPLHAAYGGVCAFAMLGPRLLRDGRARIAAGLAAATLLTALAVAARLSYTTAEPIPAETIAAYHQAFSSHHHPLALARYLPTYVWYHVVPFAVSLFLFPLCARRLSSEHCTPLLLGFYSAALVTLVGVVLPAVAPTFIIGVEAGMTRASVWCSLLYTCAVGAYFLRVGASGVLRLVGAAGLTWMLIGEPAAGGVGAAFPFLGLVLLLDVGHPWRRPAVLTGVGLLACGLGAVCLSAWGEDGSAATDAFRLAQHVFWPGRPGIGWWPSVTLAAAIGGVFVVAGTASTGAHRLALALVAVLSCAVGAGLHARSEHARFLREAVPDRLRVRAWCATHLPMQASVFGGPDVLGLRMTTHRPGGFGSPRDWLYNQPMLYGNDKRAFDRARARLARFGVRSEDFTTEYPAPLSLRAYYALLEAYSTGFRALPYGELRAFLRDEGGDYLLLRREGMRPVAAKDIVFETPAFVLLSLRETSARSGVPPRLMHGVSAPPARGHNNERLLPDRRTIAGAD